MGEELVKPEGQIPPREPKVIAVTKILTFFSSNPWLALISFIIAVGSLVLTIYTYVVPASLPDLTYSVSPVKAVAVKSGQVTDLEVSYKGTAITTDITVVQLAIWNKGRRPIRLESILDGIQITTLPKCQILDASIRKQSRDVIDFKVDNSHFTEGYIPISWKILEKNDGAVIQIIYAGGVDTEIKVAGIVEGQNEIHYEDSNKVADRNYVSKSIKGTLFAFLTIMTFIYLLGIIVNLVRRKWDKKAKIFDKPKGLISNAVVLLIFLVIIYFMGKGGPPFGF